MPFAVGRLRFSVPAVLMLSVSLLCGVCQGQSGEVVITKVVKGLPVTQFSTNDLFRDKLLQGLDKRTPDVLPNERKNWRATYDLFGGALVKTAREANLEAVSLEKILARISEAKENQGLALVPVAAHQTQEKGEAVWVVTLKWEDEKSVRKGSEMSHIRYFTFTQKELKQTGFLTCG